MKIKLFNFKIFLIIFAVLSAISLYYLSSTPNPQIKEVHKELPIKKSTH